MARTFSPQRLRDARRAANLRPEQLALAVERSVFSIHGYEAGRAQPPVTVLARIAEALNCPVDDFLVDASQAVSNVAG
jgi:transcriptional regulator with XRE-family HTH domain